MYLFIYFDQFFLRQSVNLWRFSTFNCLNHVSTIFSNNISSIYMHLWYFCRRATSPLRHLWEGVHSGQHPQHASPHSRRAEGLHPYGGRNLARGQRPHCPERYTGQLLAPQEWQQLVNDLWSRNQTTRLCT